MRATARLVLVDAPVGRYVAQSVEHFNKWWKVFGTLLENTQDLDGLSDTVTQTHGYDATVDTQSVFVRADDQIALELEKSGTGNLSASDLKTRQLWLPQSVDHHLAQEEISSGDLFWSLPDPAGYRTGPPVFKHCFDARKPEWPCQRFQHGAGRGRVRLGQRFDRAQKPH